MLRERTLRVLRSLTVTVAALALSVDLAYAQESSAHRRVPEGFTLSANGDLLGPARPVTPVNDPGFAAVQRILQSADVTFANFEAILLDSTFKGAQSAEVGAASTSNVPTARDYLAMGIDIVSVANNHGGDFSAAGLVFSTQLLRQVGLNPAGAGNNLAEARAPSYFQSPKGRVALVATTSTFQGSIPAGAPTTRSPGGRAGVSALRTQEATLVSEAEFATLREIQRREVGVFTPAPAPDASELRIGRELFRVSSKRGKSYTANATDVTELVQAVIEAEKTADFTIFSIHAHETAAGGSEDPTPPDFLPPIFHQLIDAGADAVVRHGPHATMGIEIYKGRPIFYSMGSLFFAVGRPISGRGSVPANDAAAARGGRAGGGGNAPGAGRGGPGRGRYPPTWYESFIPIAEFRGGQLSEIRLHPVVMELDRPELRSAPLPATGEDAQRVLERVKRESAAFGTEVRIENGVGIIRVSGAR